MATLEVTGLGISFGGLRAVDDLTMSIEKGGLVGLIGPNGAGKNHRIQHADRRLPPHRRRHSLKR